MAIYKCADCGMPFDAGDEKERIYCPHCGVLQQLAQMKSTNLIKELINSEEKVTEKIASHYDDEKIRKYNKKLTVQAIIATVLVLASGAVLCMQTLNKFVWEPTDKSYEILAAAKEGDFSLIPESPYSVLPPVFFPSQYDKADANLEQAATLYGSDLLKNEKYEEFFKLSEAYGRYGHLKASLPEDNFDSFFAHLSKETNPHNCLTVLLYKEAIALTLVEKKDYSACANAILNSGDYEFFFMFATRNLTNDDIKSLSLEKENYDSYYEAITNFDFLQFGINNNIKINIKSFLAILPESHSDIKEYSEYIDALDEISLDNTYIYQNIPTLMSDNISRAHDYFDNQFVKKQLISDDVINGFLLGNWTNNEYDFEVVKEDDGTYQTRYSLPYYEEGESDDYTYQIINCEYILSNGTKKIKQYKFDIISANKMKVYCYKTDETFTLVRE